MERMTDKNHNTTANQSHGTEIKYCYISCDSSDNARAAAICREITALGGKYCHDDGRFTGEEWRKQITDRITGSVAYIIFVSKALMARENRFVRNEFFFAGKAGKPMYAVMLDEILPEDIDGSLKKWYEEIRTKCTVIPASANASPAETAVTLNDSIRFSPAKTQAADSQDEGRHDPKNAKADQSLQKSQNDKKDSDSKVKLDSRTKIIILAAAAAVLLLTLLGIFLIPEWLISADPENFTYDIKGKNVIITSLKDDEMTSVKIPEKIEGKRVTAIGESAFSGSANLKKVRMADSVKEIQNFAFLFCEELDDVQISSSVTKIGESAFSDCTSLTSVKIPGAVIEIGPSAFQGCTALKSVGISDSVKIIGESAFMNCAEMKKIRIPDSVKSLGGSAFEGCVSLREVELSDSISEICFSTFEGCTELEIIVIPGSVKEIGDYAFAGCTSLKKAVIPETVENIVPTAFSDSPDLTIYGKAGSVAEEYAQANNIKFSAR